MTVGAYWGHFVVCQKRPLVGDDVSIAIPIARYPHVSEDWVAQTRGLRIASPMLPPGQGPLRSSVEEDSRGDARVGGGGLEDFPLVRFIFPRIYLRLDLRDYVRRTKTWRWLAHRHAYGMV